MEKSSASKQLLLASRASSWPDYSRQVSPLYREAQLGSWGVCFFSFSSSWLTPYHNPICRRTPEPSFLMMSPANRREPLLPFFGRKVWMCGSVLWLQKSPMLWRSLDFNPSELHLKYLHLIMERNSFICSILCLSLKAI